MKKSSLFILGAGLLLTVLNSCGGSNTEKKNEPAATADAAGDITSNPDYQPGLELIRTNDCLTCHKVSELATGPSYVDIAKKYTEANIDQLVTKIQKGGSGNWGQVPMTPHPNLSKEDGIKMVKYILLLKNQ